MRFRLANPASATYLGVEPLLNNLKLVSINSGTELALGLALLDSNGDIVTTLPVSLASLPALSAGSANIGDVDILSIAAGDNNIGNVDIVSALPTGTNNIGDVDVLTLPATPSGSSIIGGNYGVSGAMLDSGGTLRTINRSFVNATGIGNTELVAAQGGSTIIRVLSLSIVVLTAVTVKFQSATTDIFPGLTLGANGGIAISYNQHGIMQTAANQALNINLSLGIATGCHITWIPTT